MRRIILALLTGAALAVSPAAQATESLEQVIGKHIQARGGDNWNAIQSLKITGSFTAFSKITPFTVHRKRANKYHMDQTQNDRLVVIGYDGENAWWDNRWFQEGAQPISGLDLQVVMREVDFASPFFDYEQKGHKVKLLGEIDMEGQKTIGLELTRADGSIETWHLDPATYLEVACESTGSDFGQPRPQRTFFDDYRTVNGVLIPFFTESQWYTRDRVMRIDKVEANLHIDDALFRVPAPPGMGPFQSLGGPWEVSVQQRSRPDADWQESTRQSQIDLAIGGALLMEHYTTEQAGEVYRTLSYDRFGKKHRMTQINGRTAQMDIQEGEMDDDGRLVLSNVSTGTTWEGFGRTFHGRVTIDEINQDSFVIEQEISTDAGESWFVAVRSTYKRGDS